MDAIAYFGAHAGLNNRLAASFERKESTVRNSLDANTHFGSQGGASNHLAALTSRDKWTVRNRYCGAQGGSNTDRAAAPPRGGSNTDRAAAPPRGVSSTDRAAAPPRGVSSTGRAAAPPREYEIGKILHAKYDARGRLWYCVVWKGYPLSDRLYVLYDNFNDAGQQHIDSLRDLKIYGKRPGQKKTGKKMARKRRSKD